MNRTALNKNDPQLPVFRRGLIGARLLLRGGSLAGARLAEFFPISYRFCAFREMISWLSLSSPVSAVMPRYATDGIAMLVSGAVRLKQFVHVSSALYIRSSVNDLSWK